MIQLAPAKYDTELDDGPTVRSGTLERDRVIANHTAMMPSRSLRAVYLIQSFVTGLPILFIDLLVNSLCMTAACYLVNLNQGHSFNAGIWNQLPALLILQSIFLGIHQLYPGAGISPPDEIRGICRSTAISLICLSSLNMLLGHLPRIEFAVFAIAGLGVCLITPVARSVTRRLLARTRWWGLRVLLVGDRAACVNGMFELNRRLHFGYVPIGYTCSASENAEEVPRDYQQLGINSDVVEIARRELSPVVCFVSPATDLTHNERLMLQFPGVTWLNAIAAEDRLIDTSGLPAIILHGRCLPFLCFAPRLTKRLMDLAIAIPVMLLLSLPMLLIACLIKTLSPGPVFYASRRVGQHGKLFKMWKFRTMVLDAESVLRKKLDQDPDANTEWKMTSKLKRDPRIIPVVGSNLRRWSLDELPQLWNVIKGEMSLVGPRPVPEEEIVKYESRFYEYTQMWPGMTGLWQVSGRNDTTFETRLFLVQHYARNWSPWLDAWILIKTPGAVLTNRGAY